MSVNDSITLRQGANVCTDVCFDSLRWLPAHASAVEFVFEQDREASNLPANMYGGMGNHIHGNCSMSKLRWAYRMPFLSWFC